MFTSWRSPYYEGFGASSTSCSSVLSTELATFAARVIPKLGPYSPATVNAIQANFDAAMKAQPETVTAISKAFEQNADVELGPVAAPLIALFIKAMVGVNITDPEFVVTTIVAELGKILQPCKAAPPVVLPAVNVTEGDIGVDAKGRTWFRNAAGQLMVRMPCTKPDQTGALVTTQCEFLELDPNIAKRVNQRLQQGDALKLPSTAFVVASPTGGGSGTNSTGAALPIIVGGAALAAVLLLSR